MVGVGKQDGWWALVAADDSEFWFALRKELPELGERLLTVRTGRDCLRAIEDRKIKLAVLDSSLVDVSGTQLAHLVRRIRPDLGILVTFHRSDQAQEREARQAGILYYGDRRGIREISQFLRKSLTPNETEKGAPGCCGEQNPAASGEASPGSGPNARDARTQPGVLDW